MNHKATRHTAYIHSLQKIQPPSIRLLLCVTLGLHGCSTTQHEITPLPFTEAPILQQAEKEAIQCWQIKGKIGYIPFDPELPKGGSAHLMWQQQPNDYTLHLSGPLGQGAVTLTGDRDRVVLDDGEQQVVRENAEQLLEEALGWFIPVDALTWWVRGLPQPPMALTASDHPPYQYMLNQEGHIEHLQQMGWEIDYTSYQSVDQVMLPRKIQAVHKRLKIKLSLNRWAIQPC